MKVSIGIGARALGLGWQQEGALLDEAGLSIDPNYTELKPKEQSESWRCDPADAARALWLREKLAAVYPLGSYISESVAVEDVMVSEMQGVDYFMLGHLADDFSDAEKGHHSDSWRTCAACGNKYQDPEYVPKAKGSRLRPRPLGSFYGPLKLFCTPKFINMYNEAGFTGLTFSRWGRVTDYRAKNPLYLIHVEQHEWQDQDGVCSTCGMKTNVTSAMGCFNVHDRFLYDFQYLRVFCASSDPREEFVLSRRALNLLVKIDETVGSYWKEPTTLITPILPSYMDDLIWPEPRLCTPDRPPLYMLRANWERASQAHE